MFKTSRNYLLLALIVGFSYVYRVLLMLRETYPPGADIGLHNSVVYSITQGGNTDFLYNFFHMGGGASVTFPGYHIFTSFVILFTGIPDYQAHALVASLFSSLIVAVAFLVTRRVWNVSAALIVAFLCAVSRFDVEMLMWGGYPNVVTLMLIPLAFYLFIEKNRYGRVPFIVSASLVCSSIFLTHSLSSVLFVAITFATVLLGTIFSGRMGERRLSLLAWFLPLMLGAVLISPFLIQMAPAYFGADASAFTGGVVDIKLALISTKILPLEIVVPLLACVVLFFLFSKEYNGKFVSLPALLLVLWMLIPTILTQGYLMGLYTSYDRFLYFVIFPMIMLIGLGFYHSARFCSNSLYWLISTIREMPEYRTSKNKTLTRALPHLTRKNFSAVFTLTFILFAFLAIPVFVAPSQGLGIQSFYQLMNKPEYDAIEWTQRNTPTTAVFLTDAQYGWWFSGFAKRPTISAVDPQYLTNSREFEPAKAARYVLDTSYLVDNGLVQVREDGGYVARHNPVFLAKLNNSYFPYPFFHFNNDEISVRVGSGEGSDIIPISRVPVKSMSVENGSGYALITVIRGNDLFNFTQKTTVYEGRQFVEITERIESNVPESGLFSVSLVLHTKGLFVEGANKTVVACVDTNMKTIGQLVFTQGQPYVTRVTEENFAALTLEYLIKDATAEFSFYAGVYEFKAKPDPELTEEQQTAFYQKIITEKADSFTEKTEDLPIEVFDYRQAILAQNVSYIVVRDSEQIPRFAKDPLFSLVFINDGVAIFQVLK